MNQSQKKTEKRNRRRTRIRSRIFGTAARPRLSVFKSNTQVYAQVINDETGKTIFAFSTGDVKGDTALARSKEVGKKIADKAKENKITAVVFDRGGYVYTGKVKAIAEGAREGGLTF